ncbi:MAG: Uncharacterised protein [Polaribacter sp. SA4-10]|nr:MAG: Uncharacterised protein [Polaribacter sp. SA4-10]|tara:strand:+ start:844 stop:2127 length:1284 start_codon:yes stop_codon:yes gene_type:complete
MNNNSTVNCPNCKEVFKVDESVYTDIIKQVRDQEFAKDLESRLVAAEKEKESALKLKEAELKIYFQQKLSLKEKEFDTFKFKSREGLDGELAKKEVQIRELENKVNNADIAKKLELSDAVNSIEKERDQLINDVKYKDTERVLLEKSLNEDFKRKLENKNEAIKLKEEEIDRLKDFKQKQSTKMLGESLEQHCETEFNKLRATGFQSAYFEKDNDTKGGTKGDYIYKEVDKDGNEVMSIMFEMKNENDETASKKKNEDFFAKLNKDRKEKGCEYAILVSLLETDNEFYNTGIVDVSYKYDKMYVIRPQFFIPIITLLRNAGMKSLEYKAELNIVRNQNVDITNFEQKIDDFKENFARNYDLASRQFKTAITEIDTTIKHLEKVKAALNSSVNNLRLANNKSEDLTIKKLTNGNATMKQKFDDLKNLI